MQRKATKNTRGPNAEEKRFHQWIKEWQFCIACNEPAPTILHHCEGACFRHNKVLVGHWFVIGLCQQCDDVITHGSRKRFRLQFGPQSELWWETHQEHAKQTGIMPPFEVAHAIMDWGR